MEIAYDSPCDMANQEVDEQEDAGGAESRKDRSQGTIEQEHGTSPIGHFQCP
jgi:hypothetical protein